MYYVYCLRSLKDNKYYIGQTQDMSRRVLTHNSGEVKSTRQRIPFILIGFEQYDTRSESMWRERELKKSAHKRKQFFKAMEESFKS